jgi:hypothetical protein
MSKNHFLLTADGLKKVIVGNNKATFEDGSIVPDNLLKGYKSNLFTPPRIRYNPKLLSDMTGTPRAFWANADKETREAAIKLFDELVPNLRDLREKKLKTIFSKRVQRMNRAKIKIDQNV